MEKKVEVILLIVISIFIAGFISAESISDILHLNIQTINSSGDVVTGTFKFEFNISTSDDCANVVYNNFTDLTTDSRGVISYYLENTNLNYSEQYWLCYYRDGTLINASKIARNPYAFRARNISLSGVGVDSNLNLGGYNLTIGGGWLSNGVSILGGDIFARTLYVYNITSLNVNNLFMNGSIFPSFDNTFDLGNSSLRWQDLFLSGQIYSNGTGNNYLFGNLGIGIASPSQTLDVRGQGNFSGTIYINNITDLSLLGNRSYWNLSTVYPATLSTASPNWGIKAQNFIADNSNTLIGVSASSVPTDAYSLTAIGQSAGISNRGNRSVMIGDNAGAFNNGNYITAIGYGAGYENYGSNTTFIGANAGNDNWKDLNIGIGSSSLKTGRGGNVIAIGVQTGESSYAHNSIYLGFQAGYVNNGNNSILIGYQAIGDRLIKDKFILHQANVNLVPLIMGNFSSGNVGIGNITSPNYRLEIGNDSPRALNVSGILYVNATSGSVGIGTASPVSALQVIGGITQSSGLNIVTRIISSGRKQIFTSTSDGMGQGAVPINTRVNPNITNYSALGYNQINGAFAGGVFDGENVWLIPSYSSKLVKVNPATGQRTNYTNSYTTAGFSGGVFDGQDIWMIPYSSGKLIKLNPATGGMTEYNAGYGTAAFSAGAFDGENIWLVPYNSGKLVKVDSTGAMTNYSADYGFAAFAGGVFDGQNIWLIPLSAGMLVKVNPATGQMTNYSGVNDFRGGVFDGENVWLIPYGAEKLVKVDPATGQWTNYSAAYGGFSFIGGVFDGQNIWMVPYASGKLAKVNPNTGEITNYSVGYGGGSQAFYGGVFDGENIWLVPRKSNELAKVRPQEFGRESLFTGGSASVGQDLTVGGSANITGDLWLGGQKFTGGGAIKTQRVDVATTNNIVWSNTSLNFTVSSGKNYTIICNILFTGAAATTGQAINLSTTATATDITVSYDTWSSAIAKVGFSATDFGTALTGTGSGTAVIYQNDLVADFGTTGAGDVNLQIRSEVSGSTTTLKRGSICQLYDVTNSA